MRKHSKTARVVVAVTTDKVYRNHEKGHAFQEEDPLGGKDPYSASKSAAEMAIASYRASFFQRDGIALAAARAGNVIGGGDWSVDRICGRNGMCGVLCQEEVLCGSGRGTDV